MVWRGFFLSSLSILFLFLVGRGIHLLNIFDPPLFFFVESGRQRLIM